MNLVSRLRRKLSSAEASPRRYYGSIMITPYEGQAGYFNLIRVMADRPEKVFDDLLAAAVVEYESLLSKMKNDKSLQAVWDKSHYISISAPNISFSFERGVHDKSNDPELGWGSGGSYLLEEIVSHVWSSRKFFITSLFRNQDIYRPTKRVKEIVHQVNRHNESYPDMPRIAGKKISREDRDAILSDTSSMTTFVDMFEPLFLKEVGRSSR